MVVVVPRLRLPRGPARAQAVHPRAAPGADRRGRRRRRADRGRPPARHRRGRRGRAGPGQPTGTPAPPSPTRPCAAPGGRRCTPTAPDGRSAGPARPARRAAPDAVGRPAPARTSRCCSPTSRGASLIIAVGTHATLDEFLDRQRSGLASTFLTRLRVGPKLVDAKGVPQLYAGRVRLWHLLLVLLAGLLALVRRDRRDPGGRPTGGRRSAARCPTYSTGSKDSSRDLFPLPHRLDRLGLPGARHRRRARRRTAQGRGRQHAGRPGEDRPRRRRPACRRRSPRCAAATPSPTSSPRPSPPG